MTPLEELFDLQRNRDPQVENCCIRSLNDRLEQGNLFFLCDQIFFLLPHPPPKQVFCVTALLSWDSVDQNGLEFTVIPPSSASQVLPSL